MHWQAHDKSAESLLGRETAKILGVESFASPCVVFKRAGDAHPQVGRGDTDAYSTVVDAGDSHHIAGDGIAGPRIRRWHRRLFARFRDIPSSRETRAFSRSPGWIPR